MTKKLRKSAKVQGGGLTNNLVIVKSFKLL